MSIETISLGILRQEAGVGDKATALSAAWMECNENTLNLQCNR
jgi:hypothetical protein